MTGILCFGAGGHAAVVLDALLQIAGTQAIRIAGLVAKTASFEPIFGIPILGGDSDLPTLIEQTGATHFVVGIGMIRGGNPLRARIYTTAIEHGLKPFTVIHPSATVSPRAEIAAGACILAGAIVQPRSRIGANCIINTKASVDHDGDIGDHTHIAPGVTLSGDVKVGRTVLIGTGAVVLNGMVIGNDATLGAGAVLTTHCLPGTTMIGVPARAVGAPK